jgi:hypothetical protein
LGRGFQLLYNFDFERDKNSSPHISNGMPMTRWVRWQRAHVSYISN